MNSWVAAVHRKTSKKQYFPGQQALSSVGGFTQEGEAPGRLANKAATTLAGATRASCLNRKLKIHQQDLLCVCVRARVCAGLVAFWGLRKFLYHL